MLVPGKDPQPIYLGRKVRVFQRCCDIDIVEVVRVGLVKFQKQTSCVLLGLYMEEKESAKFCEQCSARNLIFFSGSDIGGATC